MFELKLTIDERSLAALRNMPEQAVRGLRKGLTHAALFVEGEAKKTFLGNTSEYSKDRLHVRTGRLRASIESGYIKHKQQAYVGSNVIYAAIHQFGGVIRPKRAKALHFVIDGQHFSRKSVTIPPRPYIQPEKHVNKMVGIIERAIRNELERTR